MKQDCRVRRSQGERGSALLIVFVFAAVLLIMLYREIPVASFEAQRQKEQLTIDRGHEYQRAVQLYYRRLRGQYPANLEQLENTNNLRFLRRRYKDPLTGKDDWRLLHAGPGGLLIDSKVNPIGLNANGQNANGQNANGIGQNKTGQPNQTNGSSSGFGSSSSGFGSSSFDTPAADTSTADANALIGPDGQPVSNKQRHSAPAIAATGNGADAAANGTPSTAELNADPSKPLLPTTPDNTGQANAANTAGPGLGTAGNAGPAANAGAGANTGAAANAGSGAAPTPGQTAMSVVAGNGSNGAFGQNGSTNGGQMGGGGIAGVASKAVGVSIKKVNDQTQYAKWEFYYDPSKDTGKSGQNGTQNSGQTGVPGLNNSSPNGTSLNTNSSSGFGSSSNNSSFGSSNNSSFGSSSQQGTNSGQTPSTTPGQNSGQPTAPVQGPNQ